MNSTKQTAVMLVIMMRLAVTLFVVSFMASCVRSSPVGTTRNITITTISNRADLISDGNALVRIDLPDGVSDDAVTVTLGDVDVTKSFDLHEPGKITGLVSGLEVGPNILAVHLADGRNAKLTITNHPKGGPVFAGPQVEPWACSTLENGLGQPTDDQCNAPTQISYLYQPTGSSAGSYKSYDPKNPPSDVASTTTDQGLTVPYIIRVEVGTMDRAIYKIMVLADPVKPWTATAPQRAWNRKLFVAFGGGCGTVHIQTPPTHAGLTFPFGPLEYVFGDSAADGEIQQPDLLSRGWMTTGSGLNTFNQNCNEVVSAEALMMIKEHVIENYGPILRTVSVGGSGGSIQQLNIASAYPGLLDGIVPTQSFPDMWNMVGDTSDCYLMDHYFTLISPSLWLNLQQQLAVEGKSGPLSCTEFVATLADWFDPQNRGVFHAGAAVRFGCFLLPTETYNPITNPAGTRCSVQDYQNAIWGTSGPSNAAPLPFDNTGVQYGLLALQNGTITPAQFVDLNVNIGGIDNEGNFTTARASMSDATAAIMYRADRTTDPRALANVPILDVRSVPSSSDPEGLSDMHQPFYTPVTRARLDAINGTHANMISWSIIPSNMDMAAALAIDKWLQAVTSDKSDLQLSQKIIRDKPSDIVDTCWINNNAVTNTAACAKQYPPPVNGGDARIAAGEGLTDNIRKCQLKPMKRSDYKVTFTDTQWAQLQQVFSAGVCDWTRPSIGYQPSIPWLTYASGPGGSPLGPAPKSSTY